MTLKELKEKISDKSFCSNKLMVFNCRENFFVADQYVRAMADIKACDIVYVDSVDSLCSESDDLFDVGSSCPTLSVLKCDMLETDNQDILQLTDTIIITKSIKKETEKFLDGYIIDIPKLVDWQIKDYIYSTAGGINKKKLDWLQAACKNDVYKIHNEINMIRNFSESEREFLFDDMFSEGMFSDITNFNIFNLTNALSNRDIEAIESLYLQKDIMDISDMALLTLACQNFRNIILVHLNSSPTPENTGLSDKQIYAIRKNKLMYSTEELYKIFDKLTEIDRKIKSGEFPIEILFDYILISILGV